MKLQHNFDISNTYWVCSNDSYKLFGPRSMLDILQWGHRWMFVIAVPGTARSKISARSSVPTDAHRPKFSRDSIYLGSQDYLSQHRIYEVLGQLQRKHIGHAGCHGILSHAVIRCREKIMNNCYERLKTTAVCPSFRSVVIAVVQDWWVMCLISYFAKGLFGDMQELTEPLLNSQNEDNDLSSLQRCARVTEAGCCSVQQVQITSICMYKHICAYIFFNG